MNLELLTKQVANLSRAVGAYIKNEMKNLHSDDIQLKGIHDFVTYVDKNSEKRLVAELGKILPEAGFIAEEDPTRKKQGRYNWVIDPLDGTTNFVHGVPVFSISIALIDKNHILSGVIFEINQHECFYAWKGGGAYMNGHEIEVSAAGSLEESLVATGFPYTDFSRLEAYSDVFRHLMQNTHGLRRLGSAAVDLAYVGCGRFDAFYEYGLNSWDVAAGAILVEEAGGLVTDFSGGDNFLMGREILAANPAVHEPFLKLIREKFES